jgi:glycosyltransferase involved in cell wall biosynthesis
VVPGRTGSIVTVQRRPVGGPAAGGGRRPRILLLIKCLGYGGAEQLLVDFIANRDDHEFDYEVAFVLAAENGLVPAVEASGVTVHDLGAKGNGDLRWLSRLRTLLVNGDYDLVHFHLPYAAALGRLVALSVPESRRPVLIYTEHSIWSKTPFVVRGLNRITIGRDRSLIAVSQAAADALPGPLREGATVVVHGMDQGRPAELRARSDAVRREVRAELEVPDGHIVILTVSNLRSEKGYDVLLEAARRVLDSGAAVDFLAVGRGPELARVKAQHETLGLGRGLRLLGPRSDVLRLMAGADIFVLPSHHEGLPVTIMEATSMGLAIVTTAVGEIPNFLTDGEDALIVAPGDPAAMAEAIERLARDEGLRRRLGRGALSHSAMFDVARAVKEIEAVYADLLQGGT